MCVAAVVSDAVRGEVYRSCVSECVWRECGMFSRWIQLLFYGSNNSNSSNSNSNSMNNKHKCIHSQECSCDCDVVFEERESVSDMRRVLVLSTHAITDELLLQVLLQCWLLRSLSSVVVGVDK